MRPQTPEEAYDAHQAQIGADHAAEMEAAEAEAQYHQSLEAENRDLHDRLAGIRDEANHIKARLDRYGFDDEHTQQLLMRWLASFESEIGDE